MGTNMKLARRQEVTVSAWRGSERRREDEEGSESRDGWDEGDGEVSERERTAGKWRGWEGTEGYERGTKSSRLVQRMDNCDGRKLPIYLYTSLLVL